VTASAVGGDSAGNVYVAGSFKGTVSIGSKMLTATGAVDFFLAKLDPTGTVVFAQGFGAPKEYQDPSPVMAVSTAGDVFLASGFAGTIDFGGSSKAITAAGFDGFVVHFAPSMSATWADHIGYNGSGYGVDGIALDPSGDPVVGGTSHGTVVLGTKTWTAPDPFKSQAFVARIKASDGSFVWSTASGGTLDTRNIRVAVDAQHRTFIAGAATGGASIWGIDPLGESGTFRLGFDAAGNPLWSQWDFGAGPDAISIDAAGRVSVVEGTLLGSVTVGGGTTVGNGNYDAIPILFNPADGTMLSAGVASPVFSQDGTADHGNDFTYVTGQYSTAAQFGSTTLAGVGAWGSRSNIYVAQVDATSHFVWAMGIGAGQTTEGGNAVLPSGTVAVAGNTDTAFSMTAGSVAAGHAFVALFTPATCGADPGPAIPPGDGLPGELLDAEPPGSDATPAACPTAQSSAVNGAACPVAMGCLYGTTCCSCTPQVCGANPTTWTCVAMPTQPAACPAAPPVAGACPSSGLSCTYCLPEGRYYANCTAGGWSTGYAQVICY
jgi:hypothetical protein